MKITSYQDEVQLGHEYLQVLRIHTAVPVRREAPTKERCHGQQCIHQATKKADRDERVAKFAVSVAVLPC